MDKESLSLFSDIENNKIGMGIGKSVWDLATSFAQIRKLTLLSLAGRQLQKTWFEANSFSIKVASNSLSSVPF